VRRVLHIIYVQQLRNLVVELDLELLARPRVKIRVSSVSGVSRLSRLSRVVGLARLVG
jgi:hypothetical protein